MAAYIAPMQPFEVEGNENWTEYAERFDNFLIANQINEELRKKATFLACLGGPGYKLLRSLCQNDTSAKTFDQLKATMKDHLQPKPNEIAERYRFYKRDRKTGESVNGFIAEMRKLSAHCGFGQTLNEYLHDRLVCGLNCERVQQKLLSTDDLDLDKAVKIAKSFETASREAKGLQHGVASGDESVLRFGSAATTSESGATGML